MEPTDVLYDRPGVTGVLLGVVLQFSATFSAPDLSPQIWTVSILLFAFGVVAALYADSWWRPAGQALSVAGAFVILVEAVRLLLP